MLVVILFYPIGVIPNLSKYDGKDWYYTDALLKEVVQ